MSTSVMSKFVKSKYKKCKDTLHLILDGVILTAELIFCIVMLINKFTDDSEVITNLMLCLILGTAYFYVLFEIIYIKYKQKN